MVIRTWRSPEAGRGCGADNQVLAANQQRGTANGLHGADELNPIGEAAKWKGCGFALAMAWLWMDEVRGAREAEHTSAAI